MEKSTEIIKETRIRFLNLMNDLSIDALNKVPTNFNNNIIWNFGHIIATQQVLCYQLSNVHMKLGVEYIQRYAKGTKPHVSVSQKEIDFLKQHALDTVEELETDFRSNVFNNFQPYTTGFGVRLNDISDAIKYVSTHETLHLGYAMALKRLVQ
jgi:DinB superfamily